MKNCTEVVSYPTLYHTLHCPDPVPTSQFCPSPTQFNTDAVSLLSMFNVKCMRVTSVLACVGCEAAALHCAALHCEWCGRACQLWCFQNGMENLTTDAKSCMPHGTCRCQHVRRPGALVVPQLAHSGQSLYGYRRGPLEAATISRLCTCRIGEVGDDARA